MEVIFIKIKLNNFIIECDKELSYIEDIILTLENNTYNILNFFELDKLSEIKKVIIFNKREKYKEHMLQFVPEFKDWMCADTYDGNINLLEISEAKKSEEHKDMNLDEFTKCILHEFVHSCQQELNSNSGGNSWYWEALATNLSGQKYTEVSLSNCDFSKLQSDFYSVKNAYSYSFTIGKYMLENYSKNKLLEYIKNPNLLKKDAYNIFALAQQSQKNKYKKIEKSIL